MSKTSLSFLLFYALDDRLSNMKLLLIVLLSISGYLYASVKLNSSIIMFNQHDFKECTNRLVKAKQRGATRVNLIPTIFVKLNDRKVSSYHYRDNHGHYQVMSSTFIKSYSNNILKCVAKANELKLAISFTPHLDDFDEKVWRNYFDFDPLEKYQGFSYDDITLTSLVKAINDSNQKVDLFVSGEMGKSYYLYPNSYKLIVKKLKQVTNANIGISFNYNNMLGLYNKVESISWDMIGFSNYLPIRVNCDASDFQEHLTVVKKQLSFLGLDHLPLHFNEVGIGGISSEADIYEIVKHPHRGVGGEYSVDRDPWQREDLGIMRVKYHQCLLSFLKSTDQIESAFLWNLDSWDPQGLYPYTVKYESDTISKMILNHNRN